jgi:hypothetical protein
MGGEGHADFMNRAHDALADAADTGGRGGVGSGRTANGRKRFVQRHEVRLVRHHDETFQRFIRRCRGVEELVFLGHGLGLSFFVDPSPLIFPPYRHLLKSRLKWTGKCEIFELFFP